MFDRARPHPGVFSSELFIEMSGLDIWVFPIVFIGGLMGGLALGVFLAIAIDKGRNNGGWI
jgi:hypothetical protein